MKKLVYLVAIAVSTLATTAQNLDVKPIPQINVTGEGKVRVVPDQAVILFAVETRGDDAKSVKKKNDETLEKVLRFLRTQNLPQTDVQTQRVILNPQYDYEKKKNYFLASQTIEIFLRDLNKYDALMTGLTDTGANRINSVEFKSSKMQEHERQARKLAMQDAVSKASDYLSVLNQKVGKPLNISESGQINYPRPAMYAMGKAEDASMPQARETLTIGEINITANVNVNFQID